MIDIKNVIAKRFYKSHHSILAREFTHYVFKGGRGSTKSSFVAIEIISNMLEDGQKGNITNCVALRRTATTLKDSVYAQLVWAIDILQVNHLFDFKISPLELRIKKTGQRIIFRGADDEIKLKSIKFQRGYCKYVWYEELDGFRDMEQIRSINQGLLRGGNQYIVFYSYNPPKSINSWVNAEMLISKPDRRIHHSNYLEIEKYNSGWLGNQFVVEAEHLQKTKPEKYNHEYMGEVTGTGGQVFENVVLRTISDEDINNYDRIYRGLDFGYSIDPLAYTVSYYDSTRKKLYIFYEIFKVKMSNARLIEEIKKENIHNGLTYCDSAEPKTIDELKRSGLYVAPAKKGPDSIDFGMKFLQDLEEIIIDPDRCPNTAREFSTYELEKDRYGNFKSEYPDKNNHSIDSIRYALCQAMDRRGLFSNGLPFM